MFNTENEKNEFEEKYNSLITSGKTQVIVECKYDRGINSKEAVQFNNLLNVKKFVDETNNSIDTQFYKEKLKNLSKENINTNDKEFHGGWKVIRIRTDKYYGNYMNTYKQTVLSIKENLNIEDIEEVNKKFKRSIESQSKEFFHKYLSLTNSVLLTGNKNLLEESSKILKETFNISLDGITEKNKIDSNEINLSISAESANTSNMLGNKRDKTDDLNKIMEICINKSNASYKKEHLNKCLDS